MIKTLSLYWMSGLDTSNVLLVYCGGGAANAVINFLFVSKMCVSVVSNSNINDM